MPMAQPAIPESTIDFVRFPAEIRNHIYDFVICGLSRTSSVTALPAIAFVNMFVHQEFMSRFLPRVHYRITSMSEIWYMHMLLDTHPKSFGLHNITTLTIIDFTAIAHTHARANEVADFLCQFQRLSTFSFDITLDDLYHGIQGRLKNMEHLIIEFELHRILALPNLKELVVNVRQNGTSLTPGPVSLLADLYQWLMEGVKGNVVLTHSE